MEHISEERLIETVRQSKFIYDPQDKLHSDNKVIRNAWEEIGEKLNCSAADCKKKWRLLRQHFARAIKNKKTVSGQALKAEQSNKWKYEDVMGFLKDHIHERPQISNLPEIIGETIDGNANATPPIDTVSPAETTVSGTKNIPISPINKSPVTSVDCRPQPTRRRKNTFPEITTSQVLKEYLDSKKTKTEPATNRDSLGKFFDAIEETVRGFKPSLQVQVKAKISTIVSDYEMQCAIENEYQGRASTSVTSPAADLFKSSTSQEQAIDCTITASNNDNQQNFAENVQAYYSSYYNI